MPIVRLGAVRYLNVRPLVYGLEASPDFTLRFDTPAVCAQLVETGAIDLGMVPSITYLDRPGDRIIPGVAIGSDGPVASVALFTRRPPGEIRTIALDTSSRTSAVLVRILCRHLWHIDPVFTSHGPDLPAMLATSDAALLIGDPALFIDHRALGLDKWDLGQLWRELTGLPFIWAFWAGPADGPGRGAVGRLQAAAREGAAHLAAIGEDYCRKSPALVSVAQRYLRENLTFGLGPRAIEGLSRYFRLAAEVGAVGPPRDVEFFPGEPAT